ncbi:benzoate 1,2-dioxygenase small subunit [Shimwellia blattae]|uniref:Benzoate 1,2-dioxygenase n=1 Tax=Shimwellia blattae (strain ATCC 29907 / DSM 4481 / JCM 1650 / NBRC 105725 / CDC 9005-74) TaxID=630626 RepID=I2B8Q4_SHIBC|nr:benzoate 1,2-dioxygenase small subunit [Shimwellia blattae]AFJ46908.1 benzoate 1,2-dioxygenase [Shimwellia blattae DSM 4481 = NBRC 105725]GAB82431.1 3-phenylpropionate/cinnamic acid dioxygenase beta subunit [Shimwellia blattae DSM 4481 = NBRC 105725]VDY64396.1 2-halobenzoate 1,2-dioxygenase small subunit [Shimwellia blattae]VEC22510.1 2-halobenzoate 1,2-dioxygenase small subunit [Shimwellia blattae]
MNPLLQDVTQFLYREARLLDDRDWDNWLNCYHPEAVYWMPAWTDHDQLTRDPQREISLIYYGCRDGLEDRVYRIKTERSAASTPEPRTTHMLSNIELLGQEGDTVTVRYNWCTWSHRYQKTDQFFGTTTLTLHTADSGLVIMKKVVQLNNDYINQVIDIYHI